MIQYNRIGRKKMKQSKYAILIVLASILLLGVGYASITNITLELDGDASLAGQTSIVISDISSLSVLSGPARVPLRADNLLRSLTNSARWLYRY